MKHYRYQTKGTCSKQIAFAVDGDILRDVKFTYGCSGNTQGVAALADGMQIDRVIELLAGIDCAGRGTSCPAQLAKALAAVKDGSLKAEEDA